MCTFGRVFVPPFKLLLKSFFRIASTDKRPAEKMSKHSSTRYFFICICDVVHFIYFLVYLKVCTWGCIYGHTWTYIPTHARLLLLSLYLNSFVCNTCICTGVSRASICSTCAFARVTRMHTGGIEFLRHFVSDAFEIQLVFFFFFHFYHAICFHCLYCAFALPLYFEFLHFTTFSFFLLRQFA